MKVLIIRLSSIGDIILTTPVIRSLANYSPEFEIHFLVKSKFKETLEHHPKISKLHCFDGNLLETILQLRKEKFDFILDLHNNIRSFFIRLSLQRPV
ncbi:MAG: glycosyl transferase, partial [Bacteroidia bacterium]|nr:glycosyl transferase [Bacteroidia bacterium]